MFIGQDHWLEFIIFVSSLKRLCYLSISDHSVTNAQIPMDSFSSLESFHLSDMKCLKRLVIGECSLPRVKDIQLENLPVLEELVFYKRSCNATDLQQIRGLSSLPLRPRRKPDGDADDPPPAKAALPETYVPWGLKR